MLSLLYLLLFFCGGVAITRLLLPRLRPLLRIYIGLSFGVLLMMWLPALLAYAVSFTYLAHGLAALVLALMVVAAWLLRDKREAKPFDADEKKLLRDLMIMVIPLAILSGYLQYSHSIRPDADGAYYVGQSTYGDLSLHLAVATSAVNAKFPLHNNLMLGATMAYPYLADTFASTMLMFGQSLPMAMAFTGTLMMTLVFMGYGLLCAQLCRRRGARFLAFFLLFLNGGLGFFYTLSGTVENGVVTTIWDNLSDVMNGYYHAPTNMPDPNNLRWVNIICDMLVPQRGILGGWTMLMPALNLLLPPLCKKEKHDIRALVLLGLFAGGLPLIHTHSFLALALLSVGCMIYCIVTTPQGERFEAFKPWLLYGMIAAALSLPQLFAFTFVQATNSKKFLRFQFNWCNNRNNRGLVDSYFWFYIKNIGPAYLMIFLALFKRKPIDSLEMPSDIRQNRLLASGAFLIYLIAEFIIFQPNEYDNNKLFYVWFLLCLPMVADYAMDVYERLHGIGGRRLIAALFLTVCFLSSSVTVARECVSNYQVYNKMDIEVAEYIKKNTPEQSIFITGNQHLNPVSSLAGRTILCSSESYLHYHGFDTSERRMEIKRFFEDPANNLDVLKTHKVEYIYISSYERSIDWFELNEDAIEALFPLVYETQNGYNRVFKVPEEMIQ